MGSSAAPQVQTGRGCLLASFLSSFSLLLACSLALLLARSLPRFFYPLPPLTFDVILAPPFLQSRCQLPPHLVPVPLPLQSQPLAPALSCSSPAPSTASSPLASFPTPGGPRDAWPEEHPMANAAQWMLLLVFSELDVSAPRFHRGGCLGEGKGCRGAPSVSSPFWSGPRPLPPLTPCRWLWM
jgi:hypothetical protein